MDKPNENEQKAKQKEEKTLKQKIKDMAKENTEPSEGGSVIVDRVHEPLQAALDAYSRRITSLTEIPKSCRNTQIPKKRK